MNSNTQVNEQSMPIIVRTVSDRVRIMWSMRLHSAFRTAMACAIIGGTTLYGPKFVTSHLKFPTFSYLTSILIVSDASLGDTLRGCWHTFSATAQVVPLAMLGRWIVDPKEGVPVCMVALAVGVASFLVALPENTHLMAKRIAFGQIVLVCSDAVVSSSDGTSAGFMHPLHVAASTALGAVASVLALMLPFPDLACNKEVKLYRIYAENVSERMKLYLQAFVSNDKLTKRELISEAKLIADTGSKLIHSIRNLKEGVQWETPKIIYPETDVSDTGDILQTVELPMRGIEYSLISSPGLPDQIVGQDQISNILQDLSIQLQQKIGQFECASPINSKTGPKTTKKAIEQKSISTLEQIFSKDKYECVYFFFFCIDMLLNDTADDHNIQNRLQIQHEKTHPEIVGALKAWILNIFRNSRLEFSFKCSLSLAMAVLFGLLFDKENGCWAGLTIAISFVTGKQAIFTVANTRAQGTAIGSAYGIICRFLFHYAELRILALLPWIVFTSFLRHSKMYGQTGGISALIGALLILGRKNYGNPNEFAVIRLTEVFIGLSCFILVEFFLQPTRAATLANNHLYLTMQALQELTELPGFIELKDKRRNLKSLVDKLEKLVVDAELEPDFWLLPFRNSCYRKMVGSMSNITDMLHFIAFSVEKLKKMPKSYHTERTELQEHLNNEFQKFQEALSSSLKHLEKINPKASRADSQEPAKEKLRDLELGKVQNLGLLNLFIDEQEVDEEHNWEDNEEKREIRERTVRYLGAIRFCIGSLRKEIEETEICIKEIVRWVHHSRK